MITVLGIVAPTVGLSVCSSAPGVEVTSTVVEVAPTCSVTFTVVGGPTCTCWLATTVVLKPVLETLMEYIPGSTNAKTYCPSLLDRVVRVAKVAVFTKEIDAPGTMEFDGSTTVPDTVPALELCANVIAGANANRHRATTNRATKEIKDTRADFSEGKYILESLPIFIFTF